MKNKYMTGLKVSYRLTADDEYVGTIATIYEASKLPKDYNPTVQEDFYYLVETDFEDLGTETVIIPESYIIGLANEV